MKIQIDELEKLTHKAILKYGYSEKEADIIQKILLYAQLRGNNQGVAKLIGAGIPKREGVQMPKIVKETAVSALVDANKTHAMITMDYITDLAIKKAKESGIGIAGNFNSLESTGALGYYVNKIAKENLIGLAFASAPVEMVAPFGSNEAKYCTNPMAYGIPTKNEPIILDMATSVIAYLGLVEAKIAGKQMPEGTGYDKEGNETNDPEAIMTGALKTFGGHKGSGLALVVQILAGAFVRADSFTKSDNAGNLVMAIDPSIFLDTNEFEEKVSDILKTVKNARKLPGVDEILIPGEKANRILQKNMTSREIEIEDNLLNSLKKLVNN